MKVRMLKVIEVEDYGERSYFTTDGDMLARAGDDEDDASEDDGYDRVEMLALAVARIERELGATHRISPDDGAGIVRSLERLTRRIERVEAHAGLDDETPVAVPSSYMVEAARKREEQRRMPPPFDPFENSEAPGIAMEPEEGVGE